MTRERVLNPTERSIAEQFGYWRQALELDLSVATLEPGASIAIVGCGTSYYLAQTIASALSAHGQRAIAVPGGEWNLHAENFLPSSESTQVIAVSRSGDTTETVQAAQRSRALGQRVIGITCEAGSALTRAVGVSLFAQTHPDEDIVMTSSASLMLLIGLGIAGARLPSSGVNAAEALLERAAPHLDELLAGCSHFVYLGSGPLYGLANEGALKLMEMSLSYSQAYHPLEYRHGPISLLDERTLAVMLYHPDTRDVEARLVGELQGKGARVLGLGGPGDLSLELPDLEPALRGLVALPTLQWLGERVAQMKGLDTRAPRHLTKVVKLA